MNPEGSRDDLDVRLLWPDAGQTEPEPADASAEERRPRPGGLRAAGGPGIPSGSTAPDVESVASAVNSLRAVVQELVAAIRDVQRVVETAGSRIETMERDRRDSDPTAVTEQLAELGRQVESLRKRISLRARTEQLSAEASERIAAAVIENLVEVIPEAGTRPRPRRRSARS